MKKNINSFKTCCISLVGKDLLKSSNYNKVRGYITTYKLKALKSIQTNNLRSNGLVDK